MHKKVSITISRFEKTSLTSKLCYVGTDFVEWPAYYYNKTNTGLARNKLLTSEGSRMSSTGLNEIQFELPIIQMMRLTFIR